MSYNINTNQFDALTQTIGRDQNLATKDINFTMLSEAARKRSVTTIEGNQSQNEILNYNSSEKCMKMFKRIKHTSARP